MSWIEPPQAWRFQTTGNDYYADHYAKSMAMLFSDNPCNYSDEQYDGYRAQFVADLAAHDEAVTAELHAEIAELRATIEHLRAVCRLAVSDGHATPYLTHMVDQAMKAHPDPRRVETAEELEALPEDVIVVDADGNAWQMGECINGIRTWREAGSGDHWASRNVSLPATVLWTPEASS